MTSKRVLTGISVLFVLAMLTACGGGGGDSAPPPPPASNSNWDQMTWDQDKWTS